MADRPRAFLQRRPGPDRFDIEDEVTIGRASRHAVTIEDGRVSGDHARIAWDQAAGCFVLEDLGSTNGTELDGLRIRAPEPLGRLHTITFAGVHSFVFRDLSAAALDTAPVNPVVGQSVGEVTSVGPMPTLPPPSLGVKDAAAPVAGADLPGESTDAHGAPLSVPASLFERSESAAADPGHGDRALSSGESEGTLAGDARYLQLPPELAARAESLAAGAADDPPSAAPPSSRPPPPPAEPPEAGSGSTTHESPSSPFAEIDPAARIAALETEGERGPASPEDREEARYVLEAVYEDGRIEHFPLRAGSNLIGRGRDVDIRIESPHVSRRHASLRAEGGVLALRDLGSSNHTFVAGERIDTEVEIAPGDSLRLGNLPVRVVAENGDEEEAER